MSSGCTGANVVCNVWVGDSVDNHRGGLSLIGPSVIHGMEAVLSVIIGLIVPIVMFFAAEHMRDVNLRALDRAQDDAPRSRRFWTSRWSPWFFRGLAVAWFAMSVSVLSSQSSHIERFVMVLVNVAIPTAMFFGAERARLSLLKQLRDHDPEFVRRFVSDRPHYTWAMRVVAVVWFMVAVLYLFRSR